MINIQRTIRTGLLKNSSFSSVKKKNCWIKQETWRSLIPFHLVCLNNDDANVHGYYFQTNKQTTKKLIISAHLRWNNNEYTPVKDTRLQILKKIHHPFVAIFQWIQWSIHTHTPLLRLSFSSCFSLFNVNNISTHQLYVWKSNHSQKKNNQLYHFFVVAGFTSFTFIIIYHFVWTKHMFVYVYIRVCLNESGQSGMSTMPDE